MPRNTLFLLADRALDGRLEDTLRTWAKAGVSRRAATALLAHEIGVELDPQTVHRWMREATTE